MIIWFVFAGLTLAAVLATLIPLLKKRESDALPAAHDLAVYKDQLEEIDRDLDRGSIEKTEAEAARTEISRRILNASARHDEEAKAGRTTTNRWSIAAVVVVIPTLALGLYANFGRPDLPDMPLSARLSTPQDHQDLAVLVARVEKHLNENPDDGKGWEVVAPVYLRMNELDKAIVAFRNTARLLGPTEPRLSNLGEAVVVANQGTVTAEAQAAFREASKLDPRAAKPRFFLALGLGQQGRDSEAIEAWTALLADAEGTEAWVSAARSELQRLKAEPAVATTPGGPSQEEIKAANEMSPEDRQAMIVSMVDGLDERLKSEGGPVEQWLRLINAQMVLNRKDAAQEAVDRALSAFSEDASATAQIVSAAREAGLTLGAGGQ